MPRNRKHLEGLLEIVKQISVEDGNEWFIENLKNQLAPHSIDVSANQINGEVPKNVNDIKNYLLLDSIYIIDYSEITDEKTKVQLHMDCIQMGRYRLGKIGNKPNFDEFCRYAHLQAEELINYYYKLKFGKPESVQLYINNNEPIDPEKIAKSISAINYTNKLFAIEDKILPRKLKFSLKFLSEVRNKISHRSTFEKAIKDEEELYHKYISRFTTKFLSNTQIENLTPPEKNLYKEGIFLKERKAEKWDDIYETIQILLIALISDLKNKNNQV